VGGPEIVAAHTGLKSGEAAALPPMHTKCHSAKYVQAALLLVKVQQFYTFLSYETFGD